jgi:hypothetical protein
MVNQEICNDILRYGEVISDTETEFEDGWYRQYIIKYEGETYHMTKHNGEWVFIRREV